MQRLLCSSIRANSTHLISFSHILTICVYFYIYIFRYCVSHLILGTALDTTLQQLQRYNSVDYCELALDARFKSLPCPFEPVSETLANDCGCFYILAFKACERPLRTAHEIKTKQNKTKIDERSKLTSERVELSGNRCACCCCWG